MAKTCGAKNRSGGTCQLSAGWGTDHNGVGRCKFHGGKSLVKHGRRSTVLSTRVQEAIEEAKANPDPWNVLPELAKARGILNVWLEDFGKLDAMRDQEDADPDELAKLVAGVHPDRLLHALDLISKITHRVNQQQNANHISRTNFNRVLTELGRIVAEHVRDEEILQRIRKDWLQVRLS